MPSSEFAPKLVLVDVSLEPGFAGTAGSLGLRKPARVRSHWALGRQEVGIAGFHQELRAFLEPYLLRELLDTEVSGEFGSQGGASAHSHWSQLAVGGLRAPVCGILGPQ